MRRQTYDENMNQHNFCAVLELLAELRDKVQIKNMAAKQRATRKYNLKLHPRTFTKGDLLWRMASIAKLKDGKFSAN